MTVHQSAEVARKDPARKPASVAPVFKPVIFEPTKTVETGDVIQVAKIPNEVTVFSVGVCIQRAPGEIMRLHVGDAEDPKRYISGGVITKSGGRLEASGMGSICDYPEPATVDVTIVEGKLEPGDVLRAVVGYVAP